MRRSLGLIWFFFSIQIILAAMGWQILFHAFSFCWIFNTAVQVPACPGECHCQGSETLGVVVDCSRLGRFTIPEDLPPNTTILNLSNNNIFTVGPRDLSGLLRLSHLDLSINNIQLIDHHAFRDLTELKKLYLNGNSLNIVEPVQEEAFIYLSHLEVLDIRNSFTFHTRMEDPPKIWQYLPNLQELYMDGMWVTFGDEFLSLKNLHTLSFSGGFCNVGQITSNTFKGLRRSPIQKLDLCGCNIVSFDGQAFQYIRTVNWLSVAYNPLGKALLDMASGFSIISLQHLDLNQTELRDFSVSLIRDYLCGSKLKSLTLSNNTICQIGAMMSGCFPELEVFSFSYNEVFVRYPDVQDLLNMTKIRVLDMSSQYKYCTNEYDVLQGRRKRNGIDDVHVCEPFEACPIPLPSTLQTIDLSFNGNHLARIPEIVFMTSVNLTLIRAVHTGITNFTKPIYCRHTPSIGEIDVSNNSIEFVNQYAFTKCNWSSVLKLKMGGNVLANLLNVQGEEPFFKPLIGLQVRQYVSVESFYIVWILHGEKQDKAAYLPYHNENKNRVYF